jgi:aminotransferase
MINIFQPSLGEDELAAVGEVFKSNWIGKGKKVNQFEADYARALGVDQALLRTTTCCTEGMFKIIELLGLGPGDEVILPTISFVGAANAVASTGARPVFCDVDRRTLNATAATIEEKITARTKAILIVHYGGLPCEMDNLMALARQRGLVVIEDNACSPLSMYKGRACGTIGDFGAWSFDAMKILSTGDGGMVYCADPTHATRLERLLYLGLVTKSGLTNSSENKWWEFEIDSFGGRSIMNDITAAIGVEQLRKLPGYIDRRGEIAATYDEAFANLGWLQIPPQPTDYMKSSYYLYWVQMEPENRDALARNLREQGIYTTFRYYPLHLVRHYDSDVSLPSAESATKSTLCLPLHQSLSTDDIAKITEAVSTFEPLK